MIDHRTAQRLRELRKKPEHLTPDGEKALADIWRDSIAFVRAVAESALAVYGAGAVVWHAVKRLFM